MVFETQPDKRNDEQKLQRFIKDGGAAQPEEDGEEETNNPDKMDQLQLELDNVNQHECMKNIKRCIDKMVELF